MVNHQALEKAEIKRRTYSLSVDALSKRIIELTPSQEVLETHFKISDKQFHLFPNILEPHATVQKKELARIVLATRVPSRAPPSQTERSVEPKVLKRGKVI